MIYLLDTSAISDLMQDRGGIRARLAKTASADRICTCSIVRGEILHGIARLPDGKRKLALEQAANQLFAVIDCEAVTATAADPYS